MTSCFDVGCSFGLDDSVFEPGTANGGWDIGQVRIACPFGGGLAIDLFERFPETEETWRKAASEEAFRDEMEIGRPHQSGPERDQYDESMSRLAMGHRVSSRLTVYSIGISHLHLSFDDSVGLDRLRGLMRMFAYGAFHPDMAIRLQQASMSLLVENLAESPSSFADLSMRKLPKITEDRLGYKELALLENFHPVVGLTQPEDRDQAQHVLSSFGAATDQVQTFDFKYHGRIWHSDEVSVFETRSLRGGNYDPVDAAPAIERMTACHHIARVMRSAVGAFGHLLDQESERQATSFSSPGVSTRTPFELNGLRALALSVVSHTSSQAVTSVSEDRRFLDSYAAEAGTDEARRHVSTACEVVYSVQSAETQERLEQRQGLLNGVVLILTAVTLFSVSADAYDFVRNEQSLVGGTGLRAVLLLNFAVTLALALFGIVALIRRKTDRRRNCHVPLVTLEGEYLNPDD